MASANLFLTQDLSIITDRLTAELTAAIAASTLWTAALDRPKVTTLPPNAFTDTDIPKEYFLSLYLFHTEEDPHQRNTPFRWPTAPQTGLLPNPLQPMALDLYYLLTSYSDDKTDGALKEQQAMSVALRAFYSRTLLPGKATPPAGYDPTTPRNPAEGVITLMMERVTHDEMGRLYQSFSAPFRFSAVFKASVVFLTPSAEEPEDGPLVRVTPLVTPAVISEPEGAPV